MTAVCEKNAVLHNLKVTVNDNVGAACESNENVAKRSRFVHSHNAIALHNRLDSLNGVDFCDNNVSAHTLSSHSKTLAAPAEACDNHSFAANHKVCGIHNTVECGLTCAVSVIEQMFAICIVYVNHSVVKKTLSLSCEETVDTRSCFLASADEILAVFAALTVEKVDKVAAVVDNEVGAEGKSVFEVVYIFFLARAVVSVYFKTVSCKRCGNVVLSGEGVTAGNANSCTACSETVSETCSLSLEVNGHGNLKTCEGLGLYKFLFDRCNDGHVGFNPLDFVLTGRRKVNVFDACHNFISPNFIFTYFK